MPYLGEICALLTAMCWTFSSTAFAVASRAVGPLPANQFRLVAALPVLLVLAQVLVGSAWPAATARQLWLLVASGATGLVIGDLGYFYALAKIGPRICSVIMACWPACTVAIEALLGRGTNATVLAGIALTVGGVVLVLLRNRDGASWNPRTTTRQWSLGIAGACLGAVGQAGGFVLAGYGMAAAESDPRIDPLHATVVRMATAVVGLQFVVLLHGQPLAMRRVWAHAPAIRAALIGALFGPIGGVWLSMVARAEAGDGQALGLVSALMGTTPIFMMPLAYFAYRAPVGWLGALGTVLAVGGVAVCWLAR